MPEIFTADHYRAAAANTRNNPKLQAMLEQAARVMAEHPVEGADGECRHGMPLEWNCNACSDEAAAGGRPNPRAMPRALPSEYECRCGDLFPTLDDFGRHWAMVHDDED